MEAVLDLLRACLKTKGPVPQRTECVCSMHRALTSVPALHSWGQRKPYLSASWMPRHGSGLWGLPSEPGMK